MTGTGQMEQFRKRCEFKQMLHFSVQINQLLFKRFGLFGFIARISPSKLSSNEIHRNQNGDFWFKSL